MADENKSPSLVDGLNLKDQRQLLLFIVGLIAVVLLNAYGWLQTAKANRMELSTLDLITDVSGSIFGSGYILLSEKPRDTHWAIKVAALGAKVLFALALFKGGMMIFSYYWDGWMFLRVRNHTVICGGGERGRALVYGALSRGGKVALIEIDQENAEVGNLREKGVYVITGNAIDVVNLRQARTQYARRIFSVTTKDEANLSIAVSALKMGNESLEAVAGVESFELRSFFRKIPNVRLIGFQSRAVREMLRNIACSLAKDSAIRERGVNLLVESTESVRDEVIRAAAIFFQISGERRPVIHLARTTARERSEFEIRYPEAWRVIDIKWHEDSVEQICLRIQDWLPDIAFFALNNDTSSLEAADRFRTRHALPSTKIVACLRSGGELFKVAKEQCANGIIIENLYASSIGRDDDLDDAMDMQAKEIHAAYQSQYPGQLPDWADLSEMVKDSNRLAVAHHTVKKSAWSSREAGSDAQMLDHLSRCEHMRWMAEKVLEGWRWTGSTNAESRNNERLLHNLLLPYDDLSQEDKDKDLTVVRKLLDIESA
ncbi:MAG: NAD-binding protein [bacterium]